MGIVVELVYKNARSPYFHLPQTHAPCLCGEIGLNAFLMPFKDERGAPGAQYVWVGAGRQA